MGVCIMESCTGATRHQVRVFLMQGKWGRLTNAIHRGAKEVQGVGVMGPTPRSGWQGRGAETSEGGHVEV
jgi:hypothetical protein